MNLWDTAIFKKSILNQKSSIFYNGWENLNQIITNGMLYGNSKKNRK